MKFVYEAYDRARSRFTGEVTARSVHAAIRKIQGMGHTPTSINIKPLTRQQIKKRGLLLLLPFVVAGFIISFYYLSAQFSPFFLATTLVCLGGVTHTPRWL